MLDGDLKAPHERSPRERSPRVTQIAKVLCERSLSATEGEFLGSESELLQQLDVSRPTFRQAVKIVESDCLIAVRKGQGGGIFAGRPSAADAIRTPARYLRLNGATLADIHQSVTSLEPTVARLAAACQDTDLLCQFTEFREELSKRDPEHEQPVQVILDETTLARLISKMSGNPMLELFMEIGHTFGREERNVKLFQTAEDRQAARRLQLSLSAAILEHDGDIASLMSERRAAMIKRWLSAAS